jgi:peroxiredoxin
VRIVTVSTDTPEEIARQRGRHGLRALMLSDRHLEATDRFGLRNLGVHSGPPGHARALPVPTSLLVDAAGQVLWMDQSENYQQRSDPERVRAALRAWLDRDVPIPERSGPATPDEAEP